MMVGNSWLHKSVNGSWLVHDQVCRKYIKVGMLEPAEYKLDSWQLDMSEVLL